MSALSLNGFTLNRITISIRQRIIAIATCNLPEKHRKVRVIARTNLRKKNQKK